MPKFTAIHTIRRLKDDETETIEPNEEFTASAKEGETYVTALAALPVAEANAAEKAAEKEAEAAVEDALVRTKADAAELAKKTALTKKATVGKTVDDDAKSNDPGI